MAFWQFKYQNLFSNNFGRIQQLIEQQLLLQAKTDDKKLKRKLISQSYSQTTRLLSTLRRNGYTNYHIKQILSLIPDIETLQKITRLVNEAATLKLTYFSPDNIITTLKKGWPPETLFKIAQKFAQFNLDENPDLYNFSELFKYPNITKDNIIEIVDTLVQLKINNVNLPQKEIFRYFYSNRPESEDIKSFLIAQIVNKQKDLKLTTDDYIKGILSNRKPKDLTFTYLKIKDNSLPVSKEFYLSLNFDQKIIDKIVNFMLLGKKHGLIIEFEDIVKQYRLGLNVFDILRILIKLHDNNYHQIDFAWLTKLAKFKVDLTKVLPAFNFIKANQPVEIDEFINLINRVLPIKKNAGEEPLDLMNFAKALNFASNPENGVSIDQVVNDYISGIDAWKIIDKITFAEKHGVTIAYPLAKIFFSQGKLDEIIHNTINPFEIQTGEIHVTTKDNIEIKTNITILVTYNLPNYFKGTDKEFLIRVIKTLFIDEVQHHYKHNQVIENIEKIANNILARLTDSNDTSAIVENPVESPEKNSETSAAGSQYNIESKRGQFSHFIKASKYKPVKIIIPQIEFVKETFKEIDKIKHNYDIEKKKLDLELRRLEAEIKIKEAWAKSKDLRYLILKDQDEPIYTHSKDEPSEQQND